MSQPKFLYIDRRAWFLLDSGRKILTHLTKVTTSKILTYYQIHVFAHIGSHMPTTPSCPVDVQLGCTDHLRYEWTVWHAIAKWGNRKHAFRCLMAQQCHCQSGFHSTEQAQDKYSGIKKIRKIIPTWLPVCPRRIIQTTSSWNKKVPFSMKVPLSIVILFKCSTKLEHRLILNGEFLLMCILALADRHCKTEDIGVLDQANVQIMEVPPPPTPPPPPSSASRICVIASYWNSFLSFEKKNIETQSALQQHVSICHFHFTNLHCIQAWIIIPQKKWIPRHVRL